ncbi:MAG: phosphoenolpyruvate carboxylase [bacterium]
MFKPQINRKVPTVMATQHPDNAGVPFWHDKPFIGDQDEVDELFHNLSILGNDEYMWDWEGKFADEAMIEKLVSKYFDFFSKNQIGKDVNVTLRIPNIWEEKSFKLSRAYMSILSAAEFAQSLNLQAPPVFELILPMTKQADQLIYIQETFKKTANFKQDVFGDGDLGQGFVHIVPIFESFEDLTGSAELLKEYLEKFKNVFQFSPDHLRVFIARSDPALNAGFVPAGIACKIALSNFATLEAKTGIGISPIIGCGSLPFRGGLTPDNIDEILDLYAGAKTLTIQSAFRYDYDLESVQVAIAKIQQLLPEQSALVFSAEEISDLIEISNHFRTSYCETIEELAPLINEFSAHIPKRRSRVQHIGLFGYSRGVGQAQLPRAIGFTGALYSMGLPPEFIGTGRGLKKLNSRQLNLLDKAFPTLNSWLLKSGRMINLENLKALSIGNPCLKEVIKDVEYVAEVLNLDFEPKNVNELLHRNLTSNILLKKGAGLSFESDMVEAAKLRKSIG